MKLSENWLRTKVALTVSAEALARQLTMAGCEVGALMRAAEKFEKVVVGQIISIRSHPTVASLSICETKIKEHQILTLISAASDIKLNAKVAVAMVGAKLPAFQKGEPIQAVSMRGIESQGMLCSKQELGLAQESIDLFYLPDDSELGQSLWQLLELDDNIFELELTPNRGDCLSLTGLAREVATLNSINFIPTPITPITNLVQQKQAVNIAANQDCPRYVGRLITNIQSAQTPLWMQERLRRSDIRAIHPVVDILNYVMLELGQPMHAFDADKIQGTITVRHAKPGETLTLLDKQTITLQDTTLVIADECNPLALAGIMGGLESAVSDESTSIFLESALFLPEAMAGKARRYGLHTDSSFRFERGVSPLIQQDAIELATKYIIDICGGQPGPVCDTKEDKRLPKKNLIRLRYQKISQILGLTLEPKMCEDILTRLGCELEVQLQEPLEWQVLPPLFRYDINQEIDLIEEIIRVYGYDEIPCRIPIGELSAVPCSQQEVSTSRIKRTLVDLGFQEVITYSFVDQQIQKQLFPEEQALPLLNPISSDLNVMRTSLWPGLLNILKYNQHRQQHALKIFEVGMRFCQQQELHQQTVISGLLSGFTEEYWQGKPRQLDFFDAKQAVQSLWGMLKQDKELIYKPTKNSACHPGQCAQIFIGNKVVGLIGKLHPIHEKPLDVSGPIYLFELLLDAFSSTVMPQYQRPSRFPEIRRDIAVIVDEKVLSSDLENSVRKSAGELLTNLNIFDVYQGKGIEPHQKSIAMGLILQHSSRTLVDNEIESLMQQVVQGLQKEFNAKLRE